jgi:hypothetical protein
MYASRSARATPGCGSKLSLECRRPGRIVACSCWRRVDEPAAVVAGRHQLRAMTAMRHASASVRR